MGLVQVPEGRRVFPELSVEDNLRAGAYLVRGRAKVRETLAEVYQRFPRLAERRRQVAGTLSGGEQQMLAFGRAMMTRPKLLMLDEPSLGLAPLMVEEVMRSIRVFRDSGVTVFLVEQNANLALRLADRAYVMETGTHHHERHRRATARRRTRARELSGASECATARIGSEFRQTERAGPRCALRAQ